MERAYFVRYPRTVDDLRQIHLAKLEQPYEIAYTVEVSGIEYENFIYDMGVDRQFIENHADLCLDGVVKKCLLVRRKGKKSGILVVPVQQNPSFVLWAAYYQFE